MAGKLEKVSGPSMVDPIHRLVVRLMGLEDRLDSLVGPIALALALDIIEGRVRPGQDLNSIDLARRFNSSRTPVREALGALQVQGLVDIRPRQRPRAAVLSRKTIEGIYDVRAELAVVVGRRAAERRTSSDLRALQAILATMRMSARTDIDAYFWGNVAFHERLTLSTGNLTLKQAIDSLGVRVLQMRHLGLSRPGRSERSCADHERLTLAIAEQDADLAGALNRSIVLAGLRALVEFDSAWPLLGVVSATS